MVLRGPCHARARDPRLGEVPEGDYACVECTQVPAYECAHDAGLWVPRRIARDFAFVAVPPRTTPPYDVLVRMNPTWFDPPHTIAGEPTSFMPRDIVEIVHIADGVVDGPSWLVVARLRDGRWLYASHVSSITGDPYRTLVIGETYDALWWSALTEDERDRVIVQLRGDRRAEELVRLDDVLQRGTATERGRAEARMLRLQDPDDQP